MVSEIYLVPFPACWSSNLPFVLILVSTVITKHKHAYPLSMCDLISDLAGMSCRRVSKYALQLLPGTHTAGLSCPPPSRHCVSAGSKVVSQGIAFVLDA